ncbi:hypothetical protein [Nocardia sputorum]|uniref:hypothetical protein n=1 Tax=Nocardia sputorum TaxID=2984338 RepID=UPI00249123E4|nr:hypothetical protein [Nocardia sputorum]
MIVRTVARPRDDIVRRSSPIQVGPGYRTVVLAAGFDSPAVPVLAAQGRMPTFRNTGASFPVLRSGFGHSEPS